MIEINSQSEMEKYYNKETNEYIFEDDVRFNCDIFATGDIIAKRDINARDIATTGYIDVKGNITANNITALDIKTKRDIKARNIISAGDITAIGNIDAWDIYSKDIIVRGDINATGKIDALDIDANDITAFNIYANNITARKANTTSKKGE